MINLDANLRNADWIKTLNADFPLGITLEEAQHAQDQGLPVTLAPNWQSVVVKEWDEDLHPRDEAGRFTDSDTGLTRSEANARQLFRDHGWTPTRMQENLRGLIERARESGAYEEGLHWYQNAHDTAQGFADKYGVTIEQAAGVIAVLSPDTRWGRNVAEADRLLQLVTSPTWTYTAEESDARYTKALKMLSEARDEMSQEKYEKALARAEELNMAGQALIGTHNTADLSAHDLAPYARIGTYYGNVEKAIEVARGDLSVIRGNKVEAFVDNILHPDTSDKVTIDTHMVRVIVNDLMIDDKVLASAIRTDARYNILAEQVTKIASELGVTPSQAQAIAWIQWSRVEHPDERNVLRRAATAAAKKKEIDEEEIFTDEQRLIFDLIWQGFTESEIEELKEWDPDLHPRGEGGLFVESEFGIEPVSLPSSDDPVGTLESWMKDNNIGGVHLMSGMQDYLSTNEAEVLASAIAATREYQRPDDRVMFDFDHEMVISNELAVTYGRSPSVNIYLGIYSDEERDRLQKIGFNSGFFVSGDKASTYIHELGHAYQDSNVKDHPWKYREMEIASKVSGYATTHPDEFVAEVFAGMVYGHQYERDVMRLYRALGGREKQTTKDWDPDLHPRGEGGLFVESGGGGSSGQAHNYGVEDGYAFHEKNREWANGLTRDEQATITSYAGFGSIGINALMRGDREELIRHGIHVENPERMQQLVDEAKELQRLIDEGPVLEEDTVVYRGISLPVGTDVGSMTVMDDPAFQSTMLGQEDRAIGYSVLDQGHHELFVGTDPRYNPQYPERVSVFAKIIVPAGTHYVDVETVRRSERWMGTNYRGESELLFGPAHYTIDSVKLNAGEVEYAKAGVNWNGDHDIVVSYHEVTMTYHPLETK